MENTVNQQEETKQEKLRREVKLVALVALGLFLTLVLASFSPHDPSLFTQQVFPGEKTRNLFGKAGSHIAMLLIQGFGVASYLAPLYIAFMLFYSRWLKEFTPGYLRTFSFLVASAALSAFLSALFPVFTFYGLEIPLGGFAGLVIADYTKIYFNVSGSLFLFTTVFMIFSIIALEKNVFTKLFLQLTAFFQSLPKLLEFRKKSQKVETRPPKVVKPMQHRDEKPAPQDPEPDTGLPEEPEGEIRPAKRPGRSASSLPSISLLSINKEKYQGPEELELKDNCNLIEECLKYFDIRGRISEVHPGPVITMYEFIPEPGLKLGRIQSLENEISMALKAVSLRIIAPIPGKSSIGIEVSNKKMAHVYLREIIGSEEFSHRQLKLALALGKDTTGTPYVTDLVRMPHLLVAGSTGSGKSVALNAMILSILFRMHPDDVKFIMIDPKMLELSLYRDIPHLLYPVVTKPEEAARILGWAIKEMERRYAMMAHNSVRNIEQFNEKLKEKKQQDLFEEKEMYEKLPYIIILIDELADLMMVASKEVETYITRLAQKARAAGIHMIVATQRPSVDVITGLIKANFPARIAFKVASKTDSRTILDANGSDSLLGRGDMLFLQPATSNLLRLHGPYVTEDEIQGVADFWRSQSSPTYIELAVEEDDGTGGDDLFDDDKYGEAVRIVKETRQASISMLQRRMRVGYNRAARMIERMEREGIVSQPDGSKPREVL